MSNEKYRTIIENDLIRTIKAMQIALKGADFNNKLSMKTCISVALGFAENTLAEINNPKSITEIEYEELYDDESPDYIKGSIEE